MRAASAAIAVLFASVGSSGAEVGEPKLASSRSEVRELKPGELAQAAITAVLAARPSDAVPGATVEIARSQGRLDLSAARQEMTDAFTAASLRVVDAGEPTGDIAMTVQDPRGVRALITLGSTRGGIFLIARPAQPHLPGECVRIPRRKWTVVVQSSGIDQQGEHRSATTNWELTTSRFVDLDGDGILDAFVPLHGRGQCPEEGMWDVYVMRGACGHRVGTIGPGWLAPDTMSAALDRSGFRPLTMVSEHVRMGTRPPPIPEMLTTTTAYRYGEQGYAKQKADVRSGVCHHCSVSSCTAP
jgi:hypothetical protein